MDVSTTIHFVDPDHVQRTQLTTANRYSQFTAPTDAISR